MKLTLIGLQDQLCTSILTISTHSFRVDAVQYSSKLQIAADDSINVHWTYINVFFLKFRFE